MSYQKALGDSGVIGMSIAELKNVAHDVVTPFSRLHGLSDVLGSIGDASIIVAVVASIYLVRALAAHVKPVVRGFTKRTGKRNANGK